MAFEKAQCGRCACFAAIFFLCALPAPIMMALRGWVGRQRRGTAQTTRSALRARTARLDASYGRLGKYFGRARPIAVSGASSALGVFYSFSFPCRTSRFERERGIWRLGSRKCAGQRLFLNSPTAPCVIRHSLDGSSGLLPPLLSARQSVNFVEFEFGPLEARYRDVAVVLLDSSVSHTFHGMSFAVGYKCTCRMILVVPQALSLRIVHPPHIRHAPIH